MNKEFLILQLTNIENAKRVNRLRVSNIVLENPELFIHLLELTFETNNKIDIKASWVLELVCEEKLDWLAPFLNYFTKNIHKPKHDSCVRPLSKICNFIAIAYTSKKESLIKNTLSKTQTDAIIETGFDWMISNHKVATKAYTMNALFLLGKNEDWVHQELKLLIQQNSVSESPAYKARGRMTLSLINKN